MRILRICLGITDKLPEILGGYTIETTPRQVNAWTATVLEVINRQEDFFQVRDSGKG